MSVDDNKAIVLRYYEAVHNQHDLSVIDETCEREYGEGRRRWFEAAYAAFPDLHSTAEDVVAGGDKVMIRQVVHGTHRGDFGTPLGPIAPTGKRLDLPSMLLYQVSDGRIVREWATIDWLKGFQQLGFSLDLRKKEG